MSNEEKKEFLSQYIALSNEEITSEFYNRIKAIEHFLISNISKRNTKRNAPPPFITSSLQAEASRRLKMRPKQTMMLAQKLYEGIELGKEGLQGLITYMRTDSTRINDEMITSVRGFINNFYGRDYVPEIPNIFDKKSKINIQDAHEAIRPTSLKFTPKFVKEFLDNKTYKLYELIWNRFIASQMSPALMETTVIEISANEFIFKAFGTAVKFNGFQQIYEDIIEKKENADEKEEYRNETIPIGLEKGNSLNLDELKKSQHFTKPPARFSESTLIKELESKGIGRPSTYSLIVGTIQDRKYVDQVDRKLIPTKLGREVNTILVKNFPAIINEDFTAAMENELDQIAQGEIGYVKVLNDFYMPFAESLKNVENNFDKILCDICGHEMIIKVGRFGKYLACSHYPECKNIKSFKEVFAQNQEPEYTGEACEKCGSRAVFRNGKFGRFIGCERYPDCDYIKNITLGVLCPKCKEGEIVERKSKRGKLFYGCSRFPECDYVSWYKPIPHKCINSDSEFMEHRYSVKKGNYLKCPKCGEEVIIEEVEGVEKER
jgi:DNA topoisomerase-1